MIISGPEGGSHRKINRIDVGIKPTMIYGFLLPHFDVVRSDKAPNNGLFIKSHMDLKINPKVIQLIFKPTMVK